MTYNFLVALHGVKEHKTIVIECSNQAKAEEELRKKYRVKEIIACMAI